MSIGKVHVWYMTEEERLAYIKKHPIVPIDPKESRFSTEAIDYKVTNERKKEALKGTLVTDHVDKEKLHKLFMDGKTISEMAKALDINVNTLSNYITKQRKKDPEKWPYRLQTKK